MGCRSKFNTIEEHDDFVINNYNKVVGEDDLVYILGDIGFTPYKDLADRVCQLKGRKILLVGNHDQLDDDKYRKMGIAHVIRHPIYYSDNIILSHHPILECYNNPWVSNIHGHIHGGYLMLDNYVNVNVEMCNYYPKDLKQLSSEITTKNIQSRYEPFGTEWYNKVEHKSQLSY